jgi:hypothetical protein
MAKDAKKANIGNLLKSSEAIYFTLTSVISSIILGQFLNQTLRLKLKQ